MILYLRSTEIISPFQGFDAHLYSDYNHITLSGGNAGMIYMIIGIQVYGNSKPGTGNSIIEIQQI